MEDWLLGATLVHQDLKIEKGTKDRTNRYQDNFFNRHRANVEKKILTLLTICTQQELLWADQTNKFRGRSWVYCRRESNQIHEQ